MKTILINIFDHAVAKNVFTPAFLSRMRGATNIRLIAAIPERHVPEFNDYLRGTGIEIVGRPLRFASALEVTALFIARNSIPTHTVRQIQEEGLNGSGRLALYKYIPARITWLLSHSLLYRKLLKYLLIPCFTTAIFETLLESIKPDMVFATTLYAVDDVRFLRTARRHGTTLLGMIKSWDNLTSKDFMLVEPDHLIVHNDIVAGEAKQLHGYPRSRMTLIGVPQYDSYADPSFPFSRNNLFAKLGLDPSRKLITYSAMGRWLVPHERDIIKLLATIVMNEKLPGNPQLLVRLHPAYPDSADEIRGIKGVAAVDQPGSPVKTDDAWKADWKFTEDDVRHLASTLKWSNVLLNCGSTMMLDGACLGTPLIGIAFDGAVQEPSYWRSARRLFAREHCKNIVTTGGIRVVRSKGELTNALRAYLANPRIDGDGRARIVAEQTGTLDGRAGKRLAEALAKTTERP